MLKIKLNNSYKAGLLTVILIISSLSIITSVESQDDENKITLTYFFGEPRISKIEISNEIFDHIEIEGLSNSANSGDPYLPSKGVNILIPFGKKVDSIQIKSVNKIFLGKGYNVEPMEDIFKLSEIDNIHFIKNKETYSSNTEFPGLIFEEIGTYGFRGYEILILKLNPVQYIPNTGELTYFSEITLSINLIEDNQINLLYRNLNKDKNRVADMVDNAEITSTYSQAINPPILDYDLLIITTTSLKDGFEQLKTFHDATGTDTIIKTTTDIGSNDPDVLRSYITTAYTDWGIEYVLIGADDDIIPAKDLFVPTSYLWGDFVNPFADVEESMPSDHYFGCLDGPYNYDGDDRWGEPVDGSGGGDVDLVAELYVGRAPVGSISEVENFIVKTIYYMFSNDAYLDDVLMVGEFLDFGGDGDWGGNYMDELIGGSTAHGYTTIGVPVGSYDIDKLYDRDWSGNDWPKSEIINRINNDINLINHLGHCNYAYAMKLSSSDVLSLSNTNPCFIYSQGCMAGGFDNGDCIAEYFTIKTDNAAFAVIMNARYGYGASYSTDGPSQRYHREFIDAIFGEGKTTIGAANHDSKEDNIYRISENCMRWCFYEINLFGDPAVDFLNHLSNQAPSKPIKPSGVTSGAAGKEYTYTTKSTDDDNHDVYYKWDWGDEIGDWIGPFESGEVVESKHIWNTQGSYEIKVKSMDVFGLESDWSDPLPISMPKLKSYFTFLDMLGKIFPNIYRIIMQII